MEKKEGEGGSTVFLERSSRATRGKRLTSLVDDEVEADEEFWGQDAFREDLGDNEYEAEEEVNDEFDSDFDEDEANVEEEAPEEDFERIKRKRILPPGAKKFKEKKKTTTSKLKGLEAIEAAVEGASTHQDDLESFSTSISATKLPNETNEAGDDFEGERTVRKSTRTAVVIRQAERDALRAAMQATIKPVKRKREGEKRITQEDMLLEAAQTEIMNRQNLERMLAREEEVKQKAIVHKTVYTGPQVRFYSRDGKNFVEFLGVDVAARQLFDRRKPRPRRHLLCVVTGLPAKYIDPLTKLPYATKEAFKSIRQSVDRLGKESQMGTVNSLWKRVRSARSLSPANRLSAIKAKRLTPNPSRLLGCFESSAMQDDILKKIQMSPYQAPSYSSAQALDQDHVHLPAQTPSNAILPVKGLFKDSEALLQLQASSEATAPRASRSSNVPLWVDIPLPVEEPNEDDFKLDDLTSLSFGPILTLQHEFAVDESQRDHEFDLMQTPSGETMVPLDELPMPNFVDGTQQLNILIVGLNCKKPTASVILCPVVRP